MLRIITNRVRGHSNLFPIALTFQEFSITSKIAEKFSSVIKVNDNKSVANVQLPDVEEEDSDMEEMFIQGPAGMEWGGPTRGGRRPEPTRYGDWERKGRTTDF